MEIKLQIKYSSELHSWLCFRHAVKLASEGTDIATDIDNYSSEYYMGDTWCRLCEEEDSTTKDELKADKKRVISKLLGSVVPRR